MRNVLKFIHLFQDSRSLAISIFVDLLCDSLVEKGILYVCDVCEIHTILIDRCVRESISDCLMRNRPLASADYSSKSAFTSHFGHTRTTSSRTAAAFDASLLDASRTASRSTPTASIPSSSTASTPISTSARISTSPSSSTSTSTIPRTYSRSRKD